MGHRSLCIYITDVDKLAIVDKYCVWARFVIHYKYMFYLGLEFVINATLVARLVCFKLSRCITYWL